MEQLKFQEEVADSGGENPVMGGAEVLLWLDFQFSNKTLTTKKEPFFQRNKNFYTTAITPAFDSFLNNYVQDSPSNDLT